MMSDTTEAAVVVAQAKMIRVRDERIATLEAELASIRTKVIVGPDEIGALPAQYWEMARDWLLSEVIPKGTVT